MIVLKRDFVTGIEPSKGGRVEEGGSILAMTAPDYRTGVSSDARGARESVVQGSAVRLRKTNSPGSPRRRADLTDAERYRAQ
jgi:hypothetical protein